MKKLLFLSPLPPPHYGAAMSSEACLKILNDSSEFEVENIKLNYSKEMSDVGKINLSKILGVFKVRKEIKEKTKQFQPDEIYFVPATSGFGLIRDSFFVSIIKKKSKNKILFHIRSRIQDEDWNNKKYQKMYRSMLSGQKAIVLDDSLAKDLHGLVEEKNIYVLPNAIENAISDDEIKRIVLERKKSKEFNILFLSNMDETKGWFKLLQACKILKDKKINFKCNFVGAFPGEKEKNKFYDYVKKNNLEDFVSYLGKKTGQDKNEILKKSDALVFPTEYRLETFGRVILEGMMFSMPVIANGIAAIPNIISDGKTGFVLKENTPEEIAEKIKILAEDKKLREKMGREGRKRFLDKFEMKKYSEEFLKILNQG